MDLIDLKTKTTAELRQLLLEQKEELRQLRFRLQNQQLKQMHKVDEAKKTVARILTLLNAKK